jgi:hypothetical protein
MLYSLLLYCYIPTGAKFQVSLLVRGGWGVGVDGWSEIEIKANSVQLKLEQGLSLAILEIASNVYGQYYI